MNLKSVFFAVSSYECRCETQFEPQYIEISDPPPRDDFEPDEIDWNVQPDDLTGVVYTCAKCDLTWTGRVEKHGEKLEVLLQSEDGLRKRGISDETAILLNHSEGQRIMDLLSELAISAEVLQRHFERLDSHTQIGLFDVNQDDKIDIIADIKAYLAEAYSFEKKHSNLYSDKISPRKVGHNGYLRITNRRARL